MNLKDRNQIVIIKYVFNIVFVTSTEKVLMQEYQKSRERKKMKRKSNIQKITSISNRRFLSLALVAVISAQLFLVALANADVPMPIGQTVQDNPFESGPTTHTAVGTTTPSNLQNARDGSLDTYGSFGYGTTGNVEYMTFTQAPSAFPISWVDFKISYRASGTTITNDRYRIVYYVGSAGPVILQDWVNGTTGAKFDNDAGQAQRAWSLQTEPNDGAWDWTDIGNVRLRVETQRVGTDDGQRVFLYEVWLSVYSGPLPPQGAVSIQPSSILGLTAGSTFFVDVYATNVINLWGYQFTITYDTSILTALDPGGAFDDAYFSYNPFNNLFAFEVNDASGFVAATYTSFFGDSVGFTGSTPLARLYFVVSVEGYSPIHFNMLKVVNTKGGEITVATYDAVFSSSAVHDVAVTGIQVDPTVLAPGGIVQINVTAANQGTAPETFDVSAFYDSSLIGTQTLTSLPPSTEETLFFNWDTNGIAVGQYSIKANASIVPDEIDADDNSYTDGAVTLQQPSDLPVALFDFKPHTPFIGDGVVFDASTSFTPSGTEITSYKWDFGDGNKVVYLKNINLTSFASHSYKSPGAFVVTLEVTNDKSLSDIVSMVVTIYGGFATWLYAPVITSMDLTTGSTFSINISVNNIENLWGVQFLVKYNTSVLTAIDYAFYSPFDGPLPSEINDTAGYVALARYTYMGDMNGVTTNTPKPIVRIDFSVDADGTSPIKLMLEDPDLDFYGALTNTAGGIIKNVELVDGYFSNIAEVGNHDVAIVNMMVDATTIKPGDQVPIYVTVFNQGDSNEVFDMSVYLDGTPIETLFLVSLGVGETKAMRFVWNTYGLTGAYSISGEVRLMSDIDPVDNLYVYGKVTVGIIVKAHVLFDQTHGTESVSDYSNWISGLVARGYTVDTWQGGPITPMVLTGCDVFVIPQAYQSYSPSEISVIQSFVNGGGGLLVIGDDYPYIYTDLTSFAGIVWNSGGAMGGYLTDITPHPVTEGVTTVYFAAPVSYLTLTSPALDLIRDQYGSVMLAVSESGSGKVLGIADENTIDNWDIGYADNLRLANNMIDWFILKFEHEISVTLEAYPYMKPGDSALLNATVRNFGSQNETSVELTLMIDDVTVDSTVIPQLMVGESYTLTYLWNPGLTGFYNVTAYATPVQDETSTANNRATKLITVAYPLIQPLEGQWANYSITYTEISTGRTETLLLNMTYARYISPYQMNVTLWMRSPYGGNGTSWLILNIMTRRVEAGAWNGLWYPLWVEPNVQVGSVVNILNTVGTIIGSRLVEVGDFLIDSWELQFYYYSERYSFLFDKVTGVVTAVDGETPYATETWKLLATNILRLLKMQVNPQNGIVGTQVTVTGEDATPNGIVEVFWDNALIGTTMADTAGKFTFTFNIPEGTRGIHRIIAIDLQTHKPGIALFTVLSSITISPASGPAGAKLQVTGLGFAADEHVVLSFDDMRFAEAYANEVGSFTATFSVPFSESGTHTVKAWYSDTHLETAFTVINTTPLEATVDVGAMYFKGETAEFYVQTALNGKPVDVTVINATLYLPDGTTQKLTAQRIAVGLYRIRCPLTGKGSMIGTYTLVIETNLKISTINANGTSIRTFIVKPTWERDAPKIATLSVASIGLVSAMVLLWRKEKKKFP